MTTEAKLPEPKVAEPKLTQPKLAAAEGRSVEDELHGALARVRGAARREGVIPYERRVEALDRLFELLRDRKRDICDAADADYGCRSSHETLMLEVYLAVGAARYARDNLRKWMKPKKVSIHWLFKPSSAYVLYQPLGVVGIIVPWNYPLYLAISPLVGALAAGNRAMIKPSEFTPRTGELLERLLGEAFPPELVTVVNGGPEVGRAFSALPFDHLLFTGSPAVGKLVMRAASENLTPVTLELGGKSPTIVGDDYPLERAATSIISNKLLNAGQTCVAPDYVLVPEAKVADFVRHAKQTVPKLYPQLANNGDYTSIINQRHRDRIRALVEDAREKGAEVIEINPAGDAPEALGNKLAPTLLVGVTDEMKVMQEEIFGPVLPIKPYNQLQDAIDYINDRPRPLALYLFSDHKPSVDRVVNETVSGGVTINDTMTHAGMEELPFGGVGNSGMGHYHGFDGFETFSKKKPIYAQSRISTRALLRPPYGKMVDRMLRLFLGE